MSDERKDGGRAFPMSTVDGYSQDGMTLRDWFAGQALSCSSALQQDVLNAASKSLGISIQGVHAKLAYEIADAMLAERARAAIAHAEDSHV